LVKECSIKLTLSRVFGKGLWYILPAEYLVMGFSPIFQLAEYFGMSGSVHIAFTVKKTKAL